jgi:transcriptional regulator with XRE-family HTH domain
MKGNEAVTDLGDEGARGRLAEQLRRLRDEVGMSLKELEARTHISDSSLSRYLSGKSLPPWQVVVALCELADRDPEELRPSWTQAHRPPPTERVESVPSPVSESVAPVRRGRRLLTVTGVFAAGVVAGLGGPPVVGFAGHEYHDLTTPGPPPKPPPNPLVHENPASGPTGRFDYVIDPYVRTKTQPGEFRMTLRKSPSGWLCVKLINSATGAVIGRPECLNDNDTKTMVTYVPAVTRFQVAGMSGAAGQYRGFMYY